MSDIITEINLHIKDVEKKLSSEQELDQKDMEVLLLTSLIKEATGER